MIGSNFKQYLTSKKVWMPLH